MGSCNSTVPGAKRTQRYCGGVGRVPGECTEQSVSRDVTGAPPVGAIFNEEGVGNNQSCPFIGRVPAGCNLIVSVSKGG